MDAFHINWTRPYFSRKKGNMYKQEDFEILTTILSALKWREKNGSIKMVTDEIGYKYYKDLGIEKIWDLGIEKSLEGEGEDIDSNVFWAGGKIFALAHQSAPCIMIDTDFIVWDKIDFNKFGEDVAVIHFEEISQSIYPNKEFFNLKNDYEINPQFSWNVLPCNTAFLYIGNNLFKNYYTTESITFMKNSLNPRDVLIYMVFAEQRLISMCADKMGIPIYEISKMQNLFSDNNKLFTHIWGYKGILMNNQEERYKFCKRCIKRIENDFSDYMEMLKNVEPLKKYFKTS